MASIEEQIAELRKKSAELGPTVEKIETERAQRAELEALRLKVRRQENAIRDAPHIEAATEKHGAPGVDIAVIDTDLGAVVVKRPPHLVYQRFVSKEKRTAEDCWNFVRPCLVYPDAAAFTTITEEKPNVLYEVAGALIDLAQARAEGLAGK